MKRLLVLLTVALAVCGANAQAIPLRVQPPVVSSYAGAKIVTQREVANPLAGMYVFIRAGLDRQTPRQNGLAALVAQCILQTPVAGHPLRDALLAHGGSVNFTMDGRWVRFYVEGVSANFAAGILPLFETALEKPDFSVVNIGAARAELQRRIAEEEKIPLDVGMQMLNASFYTDSDAGLPQFGLPGTLAGFTGADAEKFHAMYYRRGGALVSADGGLDAVTDAQLSRVLDALPAGVTQAAPVQFGKGSFAGRHLITHRDVSAPWLVAQFRAPSIDSRDFGSMLVLASFLERTTAQVAENPSITTKALAQRAVGTIYNFDERPASVVLYINGGFGDPSRPFSTVLSVIQIFARSKITGDLAGMKSIAAGSYLDEAGSLDDRAWLAGVFAMQNLPPDYVGRGLNAIAAVRPADLQRVARTYFDNPNVAVVLPRDAPSPY